MKASGLVDAHGGTYEYDVTWSIVADRVQWDARVRRDGQYKGMPTGQILAASKIPDIEASVRHVVENGIRLRVAIQE